MKKDKYTEVHLLREVLKCIYKENCLRNKSRKECFEIYIWKESFQAYLQQEMISAP